MFDTWARLIPERNDHPEAETEDERRDDRECLWQVRKYTLELLSSRSKSELTLGMCVWAEERPPLISRPRAVFIKASSLDLGKVEIVDVAY